MYELRRNLQKGIEMITVDRIEYNNIISHGFETDLLFKRPNQNRIFKIRKIVELSGIKYLSNCHNQRSA
jgi:hypothetical protein